MNGNRRALALALTLAALSFGAILLGGPHEPKASARQSEGARKPRGPVAGPAIPLPRGEGETPEQSQQAEGAKGAAASQRRWEYCAITGTIPKQTGFNAAPAKALVRRYPNDLEEVEGRDEEDALANAFARLGDEGWELVGIKQTLNVSDGYGKSTHVYFFKRPK